MGTVAKRPTSVTVIGWIFIVTAILIIFSGVMGFMAFSFIEQMKQEGMPQIPEGMPMPFKAMSVIFKYFGILALLQIVFAVFVLIAGVQFLRLKAWARTALEIVSWLSLFYIIGFGIFWVASWISMTPGLSSVKGAPPAMFKIIGAGMGIMVMAVFAILISVIIKFLRGAEIKKTVCQ